jgi:ParB-like chromosome segregation protein Spo0J
MPTQQVKLIPVNKLRAHPKNARTHSKKQIRQIANSIERFGFTNPILVDEDSAVLAGHGRLAAGKLIGLREVPTLVVPGLSDAQKRAYLLADNKLAENAGWDRATLAMELNNLAPLLADTGLDIALTGFAPAEIDTLMGDLIDPESDPADEPPSLATEAVSCLGDLWLLGPHHLLCGNSGRNSWEAKCAERSRQCHVAPLWLDARAALRGNRNGRSP